ncbi:MAG: hypothetical protein K6E87_04550 [bacterium]|nr:hypothetical protein [bacterium]
MKKFLLNISKRNILKIIIVFLVMLLMILFSSIKTVYAASSGSLYDCTDFSIDDIYSSNANAYIDVTAKKRSGNYTSHMDFNSISVKYGNTTKTFLLTLVNGSDNGYVYSSYEKYLIEDYVEEVENISISGILQTITNNVHPYNVSSAEINIYYIPYATLKTAYAYGFGICHKWGVPWSYRYESNFIFSLYVENYGYISYDKLNSLDFYFLNNDKEKIHMVCNHPTESRHWYGNVDYLGNSGSAGESRIILEDAYKYDVNFYNSSMASKLRSDFNCEMYSSDNIDGLDYAQWTKYCNNWPNEARNYLNFVVHFDNGPKFSDTSLNGTSTNEFMVIQFTYWDGDGETPYSLHAASIKNNQDKPIFVAHDDGTDEDIVLTTNDEGEIIVAEGYTVDPLTGLPKDPHGNFVDYSEGNLIIVETPKSPIDSLSDLSDLVKRIISIVLGVLGFIVILKIISFVVDIFKSRK